MSSGYLDWRFTILQYADQSFIFLLELKLDCGTDLYCDRDPDGTSPLLKSSKDFQVLLELIFAKVPN